MITTLDARDFILQNIDTDSARVNNNGKRMVLLVKATWCHFCNDFLPMYERYAETMPDYKFYILEQTNDEALLNNWKNIVSPLFSVNGYPTLVAYERDGMPIVVIKDRKNLKNELDQL